MVEEILREEQFLVSAAVEYLKGTELPIARKMALTPDIIAVFLGNGEWDLYFKGREPSQIPLRAKKDSINFRGEEIGVLEWALNYFTGSASGREKLPWTDPNYTNNKGLCEVSGRFILEKAREIFKGDEWYEKPKEL